MIVDARWGADTSWADVTGEVKKFAKRSSLAMALPRDLKVPDPAKDKAKTLVVVYKYRGKLFIYLKGDGKVATLPQIQNFPKIR
jgi:hypothetical protein